MMAIIYLNLAASALNIVNAAVLIYCAVTLRKVARKNHELAERLRNLTQSERTGA